MSLKAQLKKVKNKPIPFELYGSTWYMKNLTVNEVKSLEHKFKANDKDEADNSYLIALFTDVIVDENGKIYDEITEGLTYEELEDMIPVLVLKGLAEAVVDILGGQAEGN